MHSSDDSSADGKAAEQRRFWNEWNRLHRKRGTLPPDVERRGEEALEIVRSIEGSDLRILEVGCSTGWLAQELSRYGPTTAVDLAGEVVAEARHAVPAVQFVAGDFLDLDIEPASFDVVVSLETIAHVADQRGFCERIAAVLVDEGHLALTTQNRFVWERTAAPVAPDEIFQNLLTMRELKDLLRPHFRVLEAKTILPFGHGGFLRVANSLKLNRLVAACVGKSRVRRLKERLGLGGTLVVLARRKPRG